MDRKKAKPIEIVIQLSRLTPAETLLILEEKKVPLKELLKVTFMDLLLKQVLRSFDTQQHDKARIRILKYIEIGKNYANYQPLAHEMVILTAFQKNREMQILFRHIVKLGFQNAKSENYFQGLVIKTASLKGYLKRNGFQTIFGGLTITSTGLELRKTLQAEIIKLENELPQLISNDQQAALKILTEIKGNVFLLKNIQFDLLTHIDKEFQAELNRQYKKSDDGGCSGGGWNAGCGSWDAGCGGGGCGGSGCSGCSGCGGGGCGGCGS